MYGQRALNKMRTMRHELEMEKANAVTEGKPWYYDGMIRGVSGCIDIMLKELAEEAARPKPRIGLKAPELFKACKSALGRLKQSQRDEAIAILQRVVERAQSTQ